MKKWKKRPGKAQTLKKFSLSTYVANLIKNSEFNGRSLGTAKDGLAYRKVYSYTKFGIIML
jgi:hypothetical protein